MTRSSRGAGHFELVCGIFSAYTSRMERIPYLGQTILRWQVGASTFLALPEKGARLMNWNVTLGDGTVRDLVHWPELESLDDFAKIRGGNPILFPFSGRSYDRGEIHHWRSPDGQRRPMPIHGLARQGNFRITRLDEGGFTALFVPDEEAKAAYPFDYDFVVSYRFEQNGFYVELELTNNGHAPIPWSGGHHFYFTLPWSGEYRRKDYYVEIPATRTVRRNETGQLVDGPRLQPRETLDNPALIDTIFTGLRGHQFQVVERPTGARIRFRTGFSNTTAQDACVVTWTLDEQAPFYCVEPWMGAPNAPETKIGLHQVGPGQTQKFLVEVMHG
jgi:galactose mutarotase-like enzyme